MNQHERTALARHQYDAGLAYGRDTANVILKRFPNGFDLLASLAVRKVVDDAQAHVVNALTSNGTEKRFIQPFKRGFRTGLRTPFTNHADDIAAQAVGTNDIG